MRRGGWLSLGLTVALLAGCVPPRGGLGQFLPTDVPTAEVRVQIATPDMRPTPACAPLVVGMELSVTAVNSTTALLELAGFTPNEELDIAFSTEWATGSYSQSQHGPLTTVFPDGTLDFTADHLRDGENNTYTHWNVRVTHSGGVACAALTLPAE